MEGLKRCRSCRHWDKKEDPIFEEGYNPDPRRFGICQKIQQLQWAAVEDWGDSEGKEITFYRPPPPPEILAGVVDGEEYHAALYTDPNFSCALWEHVVQEVVAWKQH